MPLYEYQCAKCRHRFERIVKFSDPPLKKCPQCGGRVEQLLSAPAVQFKGTGWYVTDYARQGGGKAATSSDNGSESKPAEKSESKREKSESKPAGKSKPDSSQK